MTILNHLTNPNDALEFCSGINAPIIKNPDVIRKYKDVSLSNKTILFEITRPNKKVKPFIDLDGYMDKNTTETEFNNLNDNICEILSSFKDEFSVMCSSKYGHQSVDRNGDIETENKLSFRITYKECIDNILKMGEYIKRHKLSQIQDLIGSEIPIFWGKQEEKYGYMDIDPSVYRGKCGQGVGKMRCPNAYKGWTGSKNAEKNAFECSRVNKIITGSIQDNLINYIGQDCEIIELSDDYLEKTEEKKPKEKKVKIVKVEKTTTEIASQGDATPTKALKREYNRDAMKPSQIRDLLMTYMKNKRVDWNTYFKIGSTLAHNGYEYELFDEWCRLSPDYNKKCDNLEDWNCWVKGSDTMNIGLIINLLKADNIAYTAYRNKYCVVKDPVITKDMMENPHELIQFIKPQLREFIRYSVESWYVYNNATSLWEIMPNIKSPLLNYIQKLCDNQIKKINDEIKKLGSDSDSDSDSDNEEEKENEKMRKKLTKQKEKWKKYKNKTNQQSSHYQSLCMTELLDNDFYSKMDNENGVIAFKDCIYHIESGETTEICYDNYLTRTLPYEYKKGNEEDKTAIKKIIKKVCNNSDELLEYYLSVLGYTLTGLSNREQNFWVFYGSNGANGKSKILELLTLILPNYFCCGNTKMLQLGNNKEHKYIPNVAKSKCAWFNELPKKNQVNSGLIKHFRDGGYIKNEILFKTEETIKVQCKMIIVSNHKVNFGKDGGMNRSIIQIPFNSTFISKEKLQKEDPNNLYFWKDKDLESKFEKMKYSVIELLCEYARDYIKNDCLVKEPQEVKEETEKSKKDNDKFYKWLDQHYKMEIDHTETLYDVASKYQSTTNNNFDGFNEIVNYVKGEMKRIGVYLYDKEKQRKKIRGGYLNMKEKTEYEKEQEYQNQFSSAGCLIKMEEEEKHEEETDSDEY